MQETVSTHCQRTHPRAFIYNNGKRIQVDDDGRLSAETKMRQLETQFCCECSCNAHMYCLVLSGREGKSGYVNERSVLQDTGV